MPLIYELLCTDPNYTRAIKIIVHATMDGFLETVIIKTAALDVYVYFAPQPHVRICNSYCVYIPATDSVVDQFLTLAQELIDDHICVEI